MSAKVRPEDIRFIYYSHQTLQVPRVARQCMVALCEGVAELGVDAEIVSFTARMHPSEPVHPPFHELYGVRAPLRHTAYRIPGAVVDTEAAWFKVARLGIYVTHLLRYLFRELFAGMFSRGSDEKSHGKSRRHRLTVVSARNFSVLGVMILVARLWRGRFVVLADVHGMPTSRLSRWVHRRVDGNVCISASLADDLRRELGLPHKKTTVAHSGVKIERFASNSSGNASRNRARRALGLPEEGRIVCYTGKVYYRYEEISYLIDVAATLPSDVTVIIVGGRPDHVAGWKEECSRRGLKGVEFRGFVIPSQIPTWLHAADLLVLYYSPDALNDYRSPGKLFEYLASGRPLVAGATRSIHEVVTDGVDGFLIEPYRPEQLAELINNVIYNDELLADIGAAGAKRARDFRWRDRAQRFVEYGCRCGGMEPPLFPKSLEEQNAIAQPDSVHSTIYEDR